MEQLLGIELASISPNILYLALLLGLWIGVTAIYIPGTGIAEASSAILIFGALYVLANLPSNWLAVFLMVVGITGFLVGPLFSSRWAQFAEAGLLLQALGGYFLINDRPVSPLLILITSIFSVLYYRLVLLPVLRANQRPKDDGQNLIGAVGRVVAPLKPTGTVQVAGELWTARSKDFLEKDTEIVVIGQRGLELVVEKAKRDRKRE